MGRLCPMRDTLCVEEACMWWMEWVRFGDVVRGCALACLACTLHTVERRMVLSRRQE